MGIERFFGKIGLGLGMLAMTLALQCPPTGNGGMGGGGNQNINSNTGGSSGGGPGGGGSGNGGTFNGNGNSNGNTNENTSNNGNMNANGNDNTGETEEFSISYIRTVPTAGSPKLLKLHYDTLYVGEGFNGIELFDVSERSDPQFLGHYDSLDDVVDFEINQYGSRIYAAEAFRGITVINTSDPENPTRIGVSEDRGGAHNDIFVKKLPNTNTLVAYVANSPLGVLEFDVTSASNIVYRTTHEIGANGAKELFIQGVYTGTFEDRVYIETSSGGNYPEPVDIQVFQYPGFNKLGEYEIPGEITNLQHMIKGVYTYPQSGGVRKLDQAHDNLNEILSFGEENTYLHGEDSSIFMLLGHTRGFELRDVRDPASYELRISQDTENPVRSVALDGGSYPNHFYVINGSDLEVYKINYPEE